GVVDTGPVPGETFEQKVERLRAVAEAAKQRADGGGLLPQVFRGVTLLGLDSFNTSNHELTATRLRPSAQGCRASGYPGKRILNWIQPQSGCVIPRCNVHPTSSRA